MIELNEPIKLLLSLVIGAVIGLERESYDETLLDAKKDPYMPLGLRTFALVGLLGAIVGILAVKYIFISLLISGILGAIFILYYYFHTKMAKDIGITTEIALLFVYIIGILVALEVLAIPLTIAISVVLILILSRKEEIKGLVNDIQKKEINAFTSYALIALVILPFLPNRGFTFSDIPNLANLVHAFGLDLGRLKDIEILNPFKLWIIVALITGVDLLGYVLQRVVGEKKGWVMASIAGGFVSSTATTLSLAQESKTAKNKTNTLVASAIFANVASFFQIALLIMLVSATFFINSLSVLIPITIVGLISGFYFLKKSSKDSHAASKEKFQPSEIINLAPALKFAALFLVIRLVSQIALEFFGNSGFLAATGIGSLAGLDAVIINTAELAGKAIDMKLALFALILANAVNLISKTVFSYLQGDRDFAYKLGASMAAIILSSLIGLLII
jgi:uncharacterized membrane protein (DUF4010 family)